MNTPPRPDVPADLRLVHVRACPRCGGDHLHIRMWALRVPRVVSRAAVPRHIVPVCGPDLRLTDWAWCPTTQEPILLGFGLGIITAEELIDDRSYFQKMIADMAGAKARADIEDIIMHSRSMPCGKRRRRKAR